MKTKRVCLFSLFRLFFFLLWFKCLHSVPLKDKVCVNLSPNVVVLFFLSTNSIKENNKQEKKLIEFIATVFICEAKTCIPAVETVLMSLISVSVLCGHWACSVLQLLVYFHLFWCSEMNNVTWWWLVNLLLTENNRTMWVYLLNAESMFTFFMTPKFTGGEMNVTVPETLTWPKCSSYIILIT